MNDGLYQRDLGMLDEQREGVTDHRGAPHLAILLGSHAPGPGASTGRNHYGGYSSRHRVHLLDLRPQRLARLPLMKD
jgi:hypothetical protein